MAIKKINNLTNLTLVVALALSSVAAYYSIIGLTAIFAGAVVPVIVMGSILEVGKITTTVWLRKYWKYCGWVLKLYLVPAVIALALLTSMGIFGFLSKAHIDQGMSTGDVGAQVSLIDEKIKTQRENIEVARKALAQMDAQVDQRLSRGDSEAGAERAVVIRRQQASERAKLQQEIGEAQKIIAKLNEERAPIASELRKVEAEVGPIKYIAAMIYGDNPDQNVLERAVRWVIILLVLVFDPLAIALVLAANSSREWDKLVADDEAAMSIVPPDESTLRPFTEEEMAALNGELTQSEEVKEESIDEPALAETSLDDFDPTKHPYLFKVVGNQHPEGVEPIGPLVYTPEIEEPVHEEKLIEEQIEVVETAAEPVEIVTEGVTSEKPFKDFGGDYVTFEGKSIRREALKEMHPEFFRLTADSVGHISTNFGTQFPKAANRGDVFVRVDLLPNRVFKFDGTKWIEINKDISNSYLHDKDYIQFLITKIDAGEYDIELLSEHEKVQIAEFLKKQET